MANCNTCGGTLIQANNPLGFTEQVSDACICTNGGLVLQQQSTTPNTSTPGVCCVVSVNGKDGVVVLNTNDINEGSTNLYFTTTRARQSVSATAPILYNNSTGLFTHQTSGVTAGTYGNSSQYPIITVNQYGHVTNVQLQSLDQAGLSPNLTALDNLTGVGYLVRTGTNTWTLRALSGASGRIAITNNNGVSAATNIDLATIPGLTTGTFGDGGNIPIITVDAYGRITAIDSTPALGSGGGTPVTYSLGELTNVDANVDTAAVPGNTIVFDGTQWILGSTSGVAANNGLNVSGGVSVQLGGALVKNTSVTTQDYSLGFYATNVAQSKVVSIQLTGSGAGTQLLFSAVKNGTFPATKRYLDYNGEIVRVQNSSTDEVQFINKLKGFTIQKPTLSSYNVFFEVVVDGSNPQEIRIPTYANTRDDGITPLNVLHTDSAGNLCSSPMASITPINIYNSDGTLTSDRTLDGAGHTLSFISISNWRTASVTNTVDVSDYFLIQGGTDYDGFTDLFRVDSNGTISSYSNLGLKLSHSNIGVFSLKSTNASSSLIERFNLSASADIAELKLLQVKFNVQDGTGKKFINIDYGNSLYQIGDLNTLLNGTKLIIDDSAATAQIFAENGFSISNAANTKKALFRVDTLTTTNTYRFRNRSGTLIDDTDLATINATYLPLAGGTMIGNLNGVTPTEITYLSGATSNIQNQINNINLGMSWKVAVRLATTANITLSGTQTIDGVAGIVGDRVLVKNQSTASQNGLYLIASGAWTRTTDASTGGTGSTGVLGMTVAIQEGTVNGDTIYICTTNAPITIGTTSLVFAKTSATTYTGSNGISLTSNNFTIDNTWFSGDASINSSGVITNTAIQGKSITLATGFLKYNGSAWIFDNSTYSTTSAANPSASIGLTAINGSATTFMRSDAAPALSQAISPTWTGVHVFNPTQTANANNFYGTAFNGTLNSRSTGAGGNNDTMIGTTFSPTMVCNSTNQAAIGSDFSPLFNTGAATWASTYVARFQGNVVIATASAFTNVGPSALPWFTINPAITDANASNNSNHQFISIRPVITNTYNLTIANTLELSPTVTSPLGGYYNSQSCSATLITASPIFNSQGVFSVYYTLNSAPSFNTICNRADTIVGFRFAPTFTNTGVASGTITNAGSGYTNGTYTNVLFTGGSGTGFRANVVVSGGVVTAVNLVSTVTSYGINYTVGNTLTTAAVNIGGTGSGFVYTVNSLGGMPNGVSVMMRGFFYDPQGMTYTSSIHRAWENTYGHVLVGTTSGNLGVGLTSTSARVHIAAGTATAGTGPQKYSPGVLLTSFESGVSETDSLNDYFYSNAAGRMRVAVWGWVAKSAPTLTATNQSLTSNVATLTTSGAHNLSTGCIVVVSGISVNGSVFNGTYTVLSTPSSTTFTYARTNADIASVACTGSIVMSLYLATNADCTIECTANTFTVTLPTAIPPAGSPAGRVYNIKNTGTGVITIATTSGQTIDGSSTQTLNTQYSSLRLQSNGTNWIII